MSPAKLLVTSIKEPLINKGYNIDVIATPYLQRLLQDALLTEFQHLGWYSYLDC